MADKVKPKAKATTADNMVVGRERFTVEMPGTAGQRSNYRQTVRAQEPGGSDNS